MVNMLYCFPLLLASALAKHRSQNIGVRVQLNYENEQILLDTLKDRLGKNYLESNNINEAIEFSGKVANLNRVNKDGSPVESTLSDETKNVILNAQSEKLKSFNKTTEKVNEYSPPEFELRAEAMVAVNDSMTKLLRNPKDDISDSEELVISLSLENTPENNAVLINTSSFAHDYKKIQELIDPLIVKQMMDAALEGEKDSNSYNVIMEALAKMRILDTNFLYINSDIMQ